MKKNYLFTPGPTMAPHEVLLAEAAPMIHHRTSQFSAILEEVVEGLQKLFGAEEPVYIVMGSGTAAMEAAVANVCSPGDKVICAPAGKFSERWADICRAYGCEVVNIELEWGQSPTPEQVEAAIARNPDARAIYLTQSETSTGAYTDIEPIAELTRRSDALLAIDAITGIGVHPCKMDEWGVDLVTSGSQKGCMMPPGLGFIAVSPRSWETIEACSSPRYYLDLLAMRKGWAGGSQTPFTPAISLVQALRRALRMMMDEGLENIHARHARLAEAARAAVRALGLQLVADSPVNGVTAAYAPEGIDTKKLVPLMRDKYGVQIAGGQGHLKGKIFRIGHMGYVSEEDMLVAIAALEKGLKEMGYEFEIGAGLLAAHKALA
ncbi:MAG: alanine--glyoxylate aminotransferase family protein [Planctomycetes bacterium]|nr:alanine--glyoxylate aminotransferase family protein [Planctomycetota bacterium]